MTKRTRKAPRSLDAAALPSVTGGSPTLPLPPPRLRYPEPQPWLLAPDPQPWLQ